MLPDHKRIKLEINNISFDETTKHTEKKMHSNSLLIIYIKFLHKT